MQFAKVDRKTGKIASVSREPIKLDPVEQSTHEVKTVEDTAKAGDTAQPEQEAS